LIKGADLELKEKDGLRPADLVETIHNIKLRDEIKDILVS